MFKALLRFLGCVKATKELDKYEPVYGFSKRSIDEWLSRNPQLKKQYEAELHARLRSRRR